MDNKVVRVIVIVFAVIGVLCVISFLAMWLMHGTMMGGNMMGGNMMNGMMEDMCRGMTSSQA